MRYGMFGMVVVFAVMAIGIYEIRSKDPVVATTSVVLPHSQMKDCTCVECLVESCSCGCSQGTELIRFPESESAGCCGDVCCGAACGGSSATQPAALDCDQDGVTIVIPTSEAFFTQCSCDFCFRNVDMRAKAYFVWREGMAERIEAEKMPLVIWGRAKAAESLKDNAAKFGLSDIQVGKVIEMFDHRSNIKLPLLDLESDRLVDYGIASVSRDLREAKDELNLTENQLVQIEEQLDNRAARQRRGEVVLPICCENGKCKK